MAKKRQSAPAYLEVLRELYRIIDKTFADGGPLPPSRVMCTKMGVSRVTYNKAVARLISEGVATSNRKGGTHINPIHQRIRKVGIVLRGAEDCPFVGREASVPAALTCLFEHDYDAQVIQASPMRNIGRQALLHNINALLWFFPRASALPVIDELSESGPALLLVDPTEPVSDEDAALLDAAAHVVADPVRAWKSCVTFLARRKKSRAVLYLGSPWAARHYGLCRELRKAGHRLDEKDCVSNPTFQPAWLSRLIVRNGIDTIITEGGSARQELLFKALTALPAGRGQPEVLARDTSRTLTLGRMYPRVRLTGILRPDTALLGRAAATIMARHLNRGTPLTSRAVDAYSIVRV